MGTVSFEVPGPGTYQVTCDPKLNPLANAASAADVLQGKQFYNDQNQAVTGTLEPAAPTYAGVLVVTVDAGAEVTATDGTTTLTATSTGTATFYLPNGGTWTVSATLNGSQSSPAAVEVQENFSLALSAGASQTVTIPTQYEAELSFLPTYTVTLSVDPAGSGTATGAGEYQQGAQAAVSAAAAEGYDFSKWTENGASVSTETEYTFTVTEDRELTAVFEAVSYGPKEFPYTGNVEALILKPGRYKLETWGAQGGYRTSASYGGKGGYSVGILELAAATNVFVRVGGSGNSGGANGGFNGGGKRSSYPGGGGASDIRIGTDDLNHRVIVAGGGGSDGGTSKPGKYGGGLAGGNVGTSGSANGYGTAGYGGTQTGNSGGASWLADAQSSATSNDADAKSGFGFGGNGVNKSGGFGGAGGGGWYGGTGRIPDGSRDDDGGGGGGSGFVWTGENAPADFGLTEAHYLKDAETIDGSKSFSAPDGTSETGHTGDGYVRITPIPPPKMYTITVLFGGNGTATGGGVFEEGTSVTVTATPNEGYKLSGWMENGEPVSTSKKYTFTADRNRTLTAEFVEGVDPRLPDGYTEVEYISNPNLTYIYIYGILSYLIEKSWEIEFLLPDTLPSSDFCIIGGASTSSSTDYKQNFLIGRLGTSTLDFQNYVKYGSTSSGNTIKWDIPKVKSTFSFHKSSETATLNGISKTPVLSGGASNTCLFGLGGRTSVSYICDYKLFSFKILNNAGTAVTAEYVPAIRESDGAVGLFLLGSESTFLQSSVSGKNFEAGPPV